MALLERRVIEENRPMTSSEIKAFANAIEIGDSIPTIVPVWIQKSTTSFDVIMKKMIVKVLKKYPFLVQTDKGLFSWNDVVIGYNNFDGFSSLDPNLYSNDISEAA